MSFLRHLALAALIAPMPAAAQDLEAGATLYAENCAVCHGIDLRGNGPMAEILVIPPPDLRQIEARYGGYFPRVGVAWLIDGRDPLVGHGGEMPIFGRVFSDMSEVMTSPGGQTVLTSPEVVDLVAFLESQQD
ncbi:c-type cytochrome [Hasllibacter sp. MH4015]|uniref:c-type cytochrome n=1 Tax=Hasllibacter sp. MH4015 TaxID=2854029 RepID=UPI001CD7CCF5|nr:cytochrome c [Hasllibacter sp. MH4015]